MGRKVEFRGSYSDTLSTFTIMDDRLHARVYATKTSSRILISGYPMRAGLSRLFIKYKNPTDEDIKQILELTPIELIKEYKPKIILELPLPNLKNYRKLHTFAGMLFAVFEYSDGYVIIDKNSYRISVGTTPYFNDDVYDLLKIIYSTKEIQNIEVLYAIDEVGEVLVFYNLL